MVAATKNRVQEPSSIGRKNGQADGKTELKHYQTKTQNFILRLLADGQWHAVEEIQSRIPTEWVEACSQTFREDDYADFGDPLCPGRMLLIEAVVSNLVHEGVCEQRERKGRQEVRMIDEDSSPEEASAKAASPAPSTAPKPTKLATPMKASPAASPRVKPTRTATPSGTPRSADRDAPPVLADALDREATSAVDALEPAEDVEANDVLTSPTAPATTEATASPPAVVAPASDLPDRVTLRGHTFVVDPEFAQLLDTQTAEERNQLEENIRRDGKCRDPLIRWKGHDILLDGHNRLALLQQHDLPFTVEDIDLPDRNAAQQWILDNQLGKRNLTPMRYAYFLGKRYTAEKQAHGGARGVAKGSEQVDHMKTAERLAARHKVSPSTIQRHEHFARDMDTLGENCGPKAKANILDKGISRSTVAKVAKLPAAEQPKALEDALNGPKKASKREAGAKGSRVKSKTVVNEPSAPAEEKIAAAVESDQQKDELILSLTLSSEELAQSLFNFLGKDTAAKMHEALGRLLEDPLEPELPMLADLCDAVEDVDEDEEDDMDVKIMNDFFTRVPEDPYAVAVLPGRSNKRSPAKPVMATDE